MTQPVAIARWHEIARRRDVAALDALLADNVVFLSPVVRTPQPGKALTKAYLGAALEALLNETFAMSANGSGRIRRCSNSSRSIDGIEVNGADFIAWNDADQIVSFKVMIRPLKAIELVRQRMAAHSRAPERRGRGGRRCVLFAPKPASGRAFRRDGMSRAIPR